jgi:hypothetical protein
MTDHIEREDALAAIAEIAARHELTPQEISSFLQQGQAKPHRKSEVITKLFGYLGGVFVFAGLVIFTSMFWADMGSLERIGVTLGSGLVAYVLAIACLRDARYLRAATPLFLIAGFLQPAGMLVAIAEYSQGGDERHALLLVFGIMIASFGLTFWKEQRSTLLFLLLAYASGWLAVCFDLLELEGDLNALIVGGFLTAVTYAISRTRHAAIAGFWFFAGSGCVLGAGFSLLEHSVIDVIFLGLASFFIYLSLIVRSRPLLFNGVLAVLAFLGYYTAEYFDDVGGWPLAMLVMGLVLIGMGKIVLELDRRYMRKAREEA